MLYVLSALMGLLVFMAVASDNLQIGQSFDNLLKNAPYVVQSYYGYMSGLALLIITAFVQSAALRDVNHRSQELIYTTPLKKTPYLLGRFFGAVTASLVPQVAVTLGILLGGRAPWVDPERVGPIAWDAHINGFVAFSIPNTFIIGAVIFAIAALTRKTAATFVGAIGLLVAYSVAGVFLANLDDERTGVLLDAFGIGSFETLTRYWTVAERNTQSMALGGDLLLNRLIWLAFAAGVLALGVSAFRFTVEDGLLDRLGRRIRGLVPFGRGTRPGASGEVADAAPPSGTRPSIALPAAALQTGTGAHVRQMLSQAKVDLVGILRGVPFRIIALLGLINAGFALAQAEQFYGLTTWPVTYQVVGLIQGTMYLFTVLVLILYTGDLVWKERSARMDQIHDALPHPIWTTALGKLLAIAGVLFVLQLIVTGMGIGAQLLQGYSELDLSVWVRELLVIDFTRFVLLAVLALLVQAVVNNRFLGYFVVVGLLAINTFVWGPLKIQTLMVRYGALPGYTYSDMAGYGPWSASLASFAAYWVPVAGVLMLSAVLVWVRGVDTSIAVRRLNLGLRLRGGVGKGLAAFVVLWVVVGAWIFQNTQVLNAYPAQREVEAAQVAYETRYKDAWTGVPQPRAVSLEYEIDIYPEERDLRARGTSVWVNRSDTPIDTIFLNVSSQVDMAMTIPGGALAREDEETNVQFWALSPAMPPGDSMTVTWTADYLSEGFENQVRVTQVSPNGTFFNNGFITPSLGYESSREMADRNERRKQGLPERPRMPDLKRDCGDLCRDNYISDDADWVTFETVISTSPDQIAVAPGSLEEEWEADGRRYFRYVLDHPSLPFASFISARYEVAREEWEGVDVEVYHHPEHTYNVEKMLRSIRRSLDYNQEQFGPYMHEQARIIEFPRYATFAQAFPGTMPYSEAIGFIARIEDEEDIDFVFYVVAHEMAHQWWAHQVIGAEVEGATLMSETLSQYSALMTMEREYGQEKIHKFLKYEMDNYLSSRGAETLQEKPLMRVDASQGYVHYRKGAVVLYHLREMLGEDVLNSALRSLVEDFAYAEPPYPTSHEMVDRIRAVTPDSLQYLIADLFEEITLYDNRIVGDPEMEELGDGRWRVRYQVQAAKIRADSVGAETEIPMDDYVDLAVLARPADGAERGEVLVRERRRLTGGEHAIEFVVDEQPWQVAVDPDYYLIDRVPDDNVARVREGA
jgi:hypothetical protein